MRLFNKSMETTALALEEQNYLVLVAPLVIGDPRPGDTPKCNPKGTGQGMAF